MTFYVKIIFTDPDMDEHGYRIKSSTSDIGCANGIWTINYIDEENPDKTHIVAYSQDSVFSVIVEEE